MKPILLLILVAPLPVMATTPEIKVDQVGYLLNAPKVALVSSTKPAAKFTVNQSGDGSVVFPGTLSAAVGDFDSGDELQIADFTKLIKPGTYYLDVPGVGRSWDFEIGSDVYARTWRLAMRSFYGQRCGIKVDLGGEYPGFTHEACHLQGAYDASSGKTGPHVSKGGWHDGGDYGRYMVNSGIATGTLLWAYEMYPTRLKSSNLDLPETGNGVPDVLNEIKWNLDWMLSMQDEDGGVWHKQTGEKFIDLVMPDKDKLLSLVIGTGSEPFKNTSATSNFAAVMAIAGRVYQPFNPQFGYKCLRAAQKAWAWTEKNPNAAFLRNPPGISTAEYPDSHCEDERLWAAAELFSSTGDAIYQHYFLDHYMAFRKTNDEVEPPSWSNVSSLAFWTYARARGGDPTAVNAIHHDVIRAGDEILKRNASSGYRISLTGRDYVRGSNGVLANYGMQLLVAESLTHDVRYRDAALGNLHYLLGRNTFSLSFVTRVGENPVLHPHHPPSLADQNEQPWPGLLAGGPNYLRQDPALAKLPPDLARAKVYVDDAAAFSANEVAINWNASLVFLLTGVLDGSTVAGPTVSESARKSRKR